MGYMDSKYYEFVTILSEKTLHGEMTDAEMDERLLKALENELKHPEIFSDWLVAHYNSAAEYLAEIPEDDKIDEEEFERCVECSKKEIAIFRQYGHDWEADFIQRLLNESIERHDEIVSMD